MNLPQNLGKVTNTGSRKDFCKWNPRAPAIEDSTIGIAGFPAASWPKHIRLDRNTAEKTGVSTGQLYHAERIYGNEDKVSDVIKQLEPAGSSISQLKRSLL